MKMEEMTIGDIMKIFEFVGSVNRPDESKLKDLFFEIKKSYFIRTVTHHYIGTVIDILPDGIVVDHCIWVADDGRFSKLMQGEWDEKSEREPYPPEKQIMLFYNAMIDATEWEWIIPGGVK